MDQAAQSLENSAYAEHYPALGNRNSLLCLVGYYASKTSLTAQAAVIAATAAGYKALSDHDLKRCILEVLS